MCGRERTIFYVKSVGVVADMNNVCPLSRTLQLSWEKDKFVDVTAPLSDPMTRWLDTTDNTESV